MQNQDALSFHEPYFSQTQEWVDFWTLASGANHEVQKVNCRFEQFDMAGYAYSYPVKAFGKFWSVPGGPTLSSRFSRISREEVVTAVQIWVKQLTQQAKSAGAFFVRMELGPEVAKLIEIESGEQLKRFLTSYNFNTSLSDKSMLYHQAVQLDVSDLVWKDSFTSQKLSDVTTLHEFFDLNRDFWLKRSDTIRNSTKRSLKQNWLIQDSKDVSDREAFYELLKETSSRQGFFTHSKSYFDTLISQEFVRLIVLKDEERKVQAAWLGLLLGDRVIHLHAGNSDLSFKKFGQPLLHLVGIYLTRSAGKKFYDFGGYEPGTGAAKFKDAYKGEMIYLPGTVDIVLDPLKYGIYRLISKLRKVL